MISECWQHACCSTILLFAPPWHGRPTCPLHTHARHKHSLSRWPKAIFLKALGPFLACVVGILVVVATHSTDGKGPIRIVKTIPQGLPPFTANLWAPIIHLDKLLPLAFIVAAVDMLESTSIARALARKNNYGEAVVWGRESNTRLARQQGGKLWLLMA